jgi:predicted metal-dependent hydrolase
MLRAIFGEYWKFYSPNFHPWNTDDRYLIAKAEASLASEAAVAA